MKINIASLSALLISAAMFTSCLKDNGFEEQKYGIKDPSGVSLGISFPESPEKDFAIDALNTAQTVTMCNLNLEADQPAPADVNVNLVLNPTLISAYNTANGTSLVSLPTSSYTMNMKVKIPKGARMGDVSISVPNASLIDPTLSYAMGLSIASIDESGYTIASNLKNILVKISVKNKYDGTYVLKSKLLDWLSGYGISNTPFTWPGSTSSYGSILMITAGPTSVKMFDDWGFGTYIHPIRTTTAWSGFGSTEPKFTFDGTTNALTAATNDFPNPPNGRAFRVNTAVTTSRWDPVTKNIYAAIIMSHPGRPDLQIFDTLVYVGPR